MPRPLPWLFFLSLIFVYSSAAAQQDIQFSQYVFNGLVLNPAYAGYKEVTNVDLTYRDQWTGLTGAPKTISASVDGLTKNERMGLGFQVIADKLGAQSSLNAYVSYSYRLLLGEYSRLCFGLAGGINQYSLDGTKLFTIDNDQALGTLQATTLKPDMKFGIFYTTEKYYASLSATDLFSDYRTSDPSYLVIYRNRHYYLQFGALYNVSDELRIKPSVIFKEDFKGPANMDLNVFFLLGDRLWVGGSYRTGLSIFKTSKLQNDLVSADAASFLVEYFISDRLRIGYSFDYSTNRLKDVNDGTHEISIGYSLQPRHANAVCPRFF